MKFNAVYTKLITEINNTTPKELASEIFRWLPSAINDAGASFNNPESIADLIADYHLAGLDKNVRQAVLAELLTLAKGNSYTKLQDAIKILSP